MNNKKTKTSRIKSRKKSPARVDKRAKNRRGNPVKKSESKPLKKMTKSMRRDAEMKVFDVKEQTTLLTFLYSKYTKISKNAVKSLLKNKQVAINGAPMSQFDAPLFPKDTVMVSKTRIPVKRNRDRFPLIYQDDEIIVINKPAGLLSIPTDKVKTKTAFRLVSDYMQYKDKHSRLYVVHRLDEQTSGVLIFAKKQEIKDAFQSNWNQNIKDRGYLAIVEGTLARKEDTLIHYLCDSKTHLMYLTNRGNPKAKKAITKYKVIAENEGYSLLDVHIFTGRKNQIRVQLGTIGHHVIGDDKYGNPSNPIKRLGLHAYLLEYEHPLTKRQFKFRAPIPKEFSQLFPGVDIKKLVK
ncbi:MAG: RluA family pseudouridine synthase [Bacilli bacterium]